MALCSSVTTPTAQSSGSHTALPDDLSIRQIQRPPSAANGEIIAQIYKQRVVRRGYMSGPIARRLRLSLAVSGHSTYSRVHGTLGTSRHCPGYLGMSVFGGKEDIPDEALLLTKETCGAGRNAPAGMDRMPIEFSTKSYGSKATGPGPRGSKFRIDGGWHQERSARHQPDLPCEERAVP
jgi:hypothetical protein